MGRSAIRVGVIGAGANTKKFHIPLLQKIDGVEVTHVCNRSVASGTAVAQEFGIPNVVDSWRELVASDAVDAIVIGTWPYMHREMTIAALEANKHVMCEARMACNAAEAREMLEAAKKKPALIRQIVPSPFTLHYDATITRLVDDGFLGKLVHVDVRGAASAFADRKGAPLHWRHDVALSGNNIMMMGIFYEAMIRWVGEAESVMAHASVHVKERTRSETGERVEVCVPDHIDISARMACGASAHMQFSTVLGLAEPTMSFWLYGTEGTIALEPQASDESMRFRAGKRGGSLETVEVPASESSSWRVEEEFIGAIRGSEKIKLTTFETGVRYMMFTDAVTKSYTSESKVMVH